MEDSSIPRLKAALERLAERSMGGLCRVWVGTKPLENDSLIAAIISNVGLDASGREADFHAVSIEDAPIWLTLFATQSLLHGECPIPNGLLEEVTEALASLGPDAQFFSKGTWQQTRRFKHYELVRLGSGWDRSRHRLIFQGNEEPLPPIDVLEDGGIIGFGKTVAFAFWVEEDD
ncbi:MULTISPECIES: hypothetical protein [Novosphingobium]|uniref:hypothetical protein n=1 Tax=Novosphingobium sp. TaxID=1874826 RepID=UPI0012C7C6A3|nr:hypothetical protein [Novosphingobium sp.]MPS69702.1 hypothetical protein [Novosphingobium sp.]